MDVSPESITASVPSSTAFATSDASARVGRGLRIIESSICVAVTTGIPAAAKALENAGLEGQVAVWGVALGKQNAEYIKNGWVKGALILDPAKMTYLGVQIVYNYLTKDGMLPKVGDEFGWAGVPTTLVEKKASYAPDVLLTPENVDDFEF